MGICGCTKKFLSDPFLVPVPLELESLALIKCSLLSLDYERNLGGFCSGVAWQPSEGRAWGERGMRKKAGAWVKTKFVLLE